MSRITSSFGPRATAREVAAGRDLSGKTVLITGGASGIGLETTRALAEVGATVVVAARNPAAAKEALERVGQAGVQVEPLDLTDLNSVRDLAGRWGDRPLQILINNAGIMAHPFELTKDGFELHMAANHLGHFLLTDLLKPALLHGAPGRVVALSSSAHRAGPVDLDDPHFERREFEQHQAYGQAKTANALFALELDRRARGLGVRAFSVMPGVIQTPLLRKLTQEQVANLEQAMAHVVKTPEQGAATTVWAAVGEELENQGGLYLEDCAEAQQGVPDVPGRGFYPHIKDPEAARRVWDWSVKATGAVNAWREPQAA